MTRKKRLNNKIHLFEDLKKFLEETEYLVEVVLVEGSRDLEALQTLGFEGKVEVYSKLNFSDSDLVEWLFQDSRSVLILTDFDEEGRLLNERLVPIFERRGMKVENGLRREFGRLMAAIGVYSIEALDNQYIDSIR